MSPDFLLFIDANQYLDLYLFERGKKLLPALEEQRSHILVTQQVVREVHRNKVTIVERYLSETLKKLETGGMAVPEHLLSDVGGQVREIRERIDNAKEDLKKQTPDLLRQISQSKDDVSSALDRIFSGAVAPSYVELRRARARKERGDPPGKSDDPLGDQLSWEQILSRCEDKPKLWIITRDSDYVTAHQKILYLNALLYKELADRYEGEPEVFCFNNIAEGLKHFTELARVKAEKLPTTEETEQIKKEQESLPPMSWLSSIDEGNIVALQGLQARAMARAFNNMLFVPGSNLSFPDLEAEIASIAEVAERVNAPIAAEIARTAEVARRATTGITGDAKKTEESKDKK